MYIFAKDQYFYVTYVTKHINVLPTLHDIKGKHTLVYLKPYSKSKRKRLAEVSVLQCEEQLRFWLVPRLQLQHTKMLARYHQPAGSAVIQKTVNLRHSDAQLLPLLELISDKFTYLLMDKFTQTSVRRILLRTSNVQFWGLVIILLLHYYHLHKENQSASLFKESRSFFKTKNKSNNHRWLDPQSTASDTAFQQTSSYFTQLLMKLR